MKRMTLPYKPTTWLFALLVVLALSSCYRDDLSFLPADGARIQLAIDWSYAKLSPNSATAVIYREGEYFRTEVFHAYPPTRKLISLPVGRYSFVVFDEQMSDYEESLLFTGKERWESFEARAIDDYIANQWNRTPTRALKSEVDTLAVGRLTDFVVTPEMLHHAQADTTLRFVPKRVFTIADIVVRVKNGLGYYFTQRNPSTLHGTAESYFFGAGSYAEHPVAHPIRFVPLTAMRVGQDVAYTTTLHIIGLTDFNDPSIPAGSFTYLLTLPFTYSGGIVVKEVNLIEEAKQFIHTAEPDHDKPYDYLFIELEIELPKQTLEEGWDVGLDDWGSVDIPLDRPKRIPLNSK